MRAQLHQSCLTLCNPMDCSLSGSSFQGILQARILMCVAIRSSRGLSNPGSNPRLQVIVKTVHIHFRENNIQTNAIILALYLLNMLQGAIIDIWLNLFSLRKQNSSTMRTIKGKPTGTNLLYKSDPKLVKLINKLLTFNKSRTSKY